MYIFLCFTISDFSDIAQIFIAIVNVVLLIYTFTYTRNKDNKDTYRNLRLQDQNIKLQWFKELIVQPNFSKVLKFYEDIQETSEKLLAENLSDQSKIEIADEIKQQQSTLRKSFVDTLRIADPKLERLVKLNLDTLIGNLTISIFDKGINLSHPPAFEKEISSKIIYSKNDLISTIYSFKGDKDGN